MEIIINYVLNFTIESGNGKKQSLFCMCEKWVKSRKFSKDLRHNTVSNIKIG